jgi:hypothetical protein
MFSPNIDICPEVVEYCPMSRLFVFLALVAQAISSEKVGFFVRRWQSDKKISRSIPTARLRRAFLFFRLGRKSETLLSGEKRCIPLLVLGGAVEISSADNTEARTSFARDCGGLEVTGLDPAAAGVILWNKILGRITGQQPS